MKTQKDAFEWLKENKNRYTLTCERKVFDTEEEELEFLLLAERYGYNSFSSPVKIYLEKRKKKKVKRKYKKKK